MSRLASVLTTDGQVSRTARLTGEQRHNLALASLGSLLEFYEFMVFGFFTVAIGKLFFPPDLPDAVRTFQAFALYSLGFVLRPLSGAIIGHLGDKFGRKKLFMFTVLMMALPTTLIGLMPTYGIIGIAAMIILLILWMLQGVAIAGEFAGASVFVTEHVPGSRVANASGYTLGRSPQEPLSDPDCPHCRTLEHAFATLDDVTVATCSACQPRNQSIPVTVWSHPV